METIVLTKHDEQLEVIEMAGWQPLIPGPANINNKASRIFQNPLEGLSKGTKPVNIFIRRNITIFLFAH